MNAFTPGIIIALLIMFLLGILAGYSWVKSRVRKRTEELKVAQRRLAEIEQSHELRLREATEKLRQDYEAELSATIEHYQDQLSKKTVEMEQIYKTRFQVLQQGAMPAATSPDPFQRSGARAISNRPEQSQLPQGRNQEAIADHSTSASMQSELLNLKEQYETRLREATQKLQTSYEQQLADNIQTAKADIETEYEQRLNNSREELEQDFAERQAQLEQELATLRTELQTAPENAEASTPSQIMGLNDETTLTLATSQSPEDPLPTVGESFTESQLEERIQAATQTAEEAFEQRLNEQLEAQQIEFDRRFREIETDYERKLAELGTAAPVSVPSPVDELFTTSDYADLTPSASAKIDDDLFDDELFADVVDNNSVSEPHLPPAIIEDDLFSDDLFADPPLSPAPSHEQTDLSDSESKHDDDEDGFEPLDLSDIV